MTAGLVLAILLSLAPHHLDSEDQAGRQQRMQDLAQAVVDVSAEATCGGAWASSDFCRPVWSRPPTELIAAELAVGEAETHFAQHVAEGRCRSFECDAMRLPGGLVLHQARGYWQVWRGPFVPQALWDEIDGPEYWPTTRAAYAAASVLGEGRRRCGSPEGAIAFFATSRCQWTGAAKRGERYRYFLSRLRAG